MEVTPHQLRVLTMLCDGASNEEMALALHVKTVTLKQQVVRLAEKLGARNRTHTAAKAIRLGIVE